MIPQKQLFSLTGYVHGGCSPIGMKKHFKTFIHLSAGKYDKIFFSAGKPGRQISMSLSDLQKITDVKTADIIK
jgi:Cys-tRNA(Pro)/Cys-tRNA(Cys) deacylase